MTKQRITIGSILEINIEDKYYVYAQILSEADCVFFDYKAEKKLKDLSGLIEVPTLFICAVFDSIITKGHWLKVGKLELRPEFNNKPMKYIRDSLNPDDFSIYNPNNGEILPSSRKECMGLECAAVWEANHVEDRIRDYYLGVPNVWLKQMKIKDT